MPTRLGKGFSLKGDRIVDYRHKLGDASAKIRRRKSKKQHVASRAKIAMMKAQRP